MFAMDWDLSNLMEGTAANPVEFHASLDHIEQEMLTLEFTIPEVFDTFQSIQDQLREAGAVVACLMGEDTSNTEATRLEARLNALNGQFEKINLKLEQTLLAMPDEKFNEVTSAMGNLRFPLEEKRKLAKEKLSEDCEALITDLSVSGLHGLMTLYFSYMGEMTFDFEGEKLNLSQLENYFSDHDRNKRICALQALETTLTEHEAIFAQLLNNLVDVRLRTYAARGWEDDLHETLTLNRTSRATLNAMWNVISKNKDHVVRFMEQKTKLLGISQLTYADYRASVGDGKQTKIPYATSARTIVDLFSSLSPKMGEFAKKAMSEKWVSASKSAKKRAGGFCTQLPLSKESRILMTYADSLRSQSTLAHELGHAFHNEAMKELPAMLRDVPINLAETASMMCEMMVHDNAIKRAKTDKEKLFLLDNKLTDYTALSMDLHSRFLFDCALHKARKQGFITPDKLSSMMVEAQKEGFAQALDSYLPHFWAYKMHFYLTDAPFYNWTYTFGYLFSLGVYANLCESGDFEERYIALLRDTGAMSVEELAQKHLGVDVTQPDFWQSAVDLLNNDIEQYLELGRAIKNEITTEEMNHPPQYLYKILSLSNWQASQSKKTTQLSAEDDAFIHLATQDQLERIIAKYWADAPQFVILKIDSHKLEGKLVFEANPGGTTKYYHLYNGFIPFDSIVDLSQNPI